MKDRYSYSAHTVFNLNYHIVWCTKYRRQVLTGSIQQRLKQLIKEKAGELGCIVNTMETMPDHVHLFVTAKPIHSPHLLAGQFKGYTSRILRKEFRSLRMKLPTLWTRSYFTESVGHVSEKSIKKYIEAQKSH